MNRLLVVLVALVLIAASGGGCYYQWGLQAADPAGGRVALARGRVDPGSIDRQ